MAIRMIAKVNHHQPPVESPFVTIHPLQRFLALGVIWAYLLGVTLLALLNQTVGAEWIIPALILATMIQWAPLIYYKPAYGWFHPLIFGPLLGFIELLRKIPLFAWGLDQNGGLPGYGRAEIAILVAYSLLLAAASQLAYYGGFFFGPKLPIPRLSFARPSYLWLKASALIFLALGLFAVYIHSQGGVTAHLLFLSQGRGNLISQGKLSGEWTLIVRISVLTLLIWLAMDRLALQRPLFWACAGLSLMSQYIVNGSRSNAIFFMVMGLLVWMLRERKFAPTRIVIMGLVAVMLLGVLGNFRRSNWSGEVDWTVLTRANPAEGFSAAVIEMLHRSTGENPTYPILARVPGQVDLLYGSSYILLLTLPVPRAIWPKKPRTTGALIGPVFFDTETGIPPDGVAEAYWNFHVAGVLFVFFLFGTFQQWLVALYHRYAAETAIIPIYLVTLFSLRPDMLSIVDWLYTTFLLLVVLLLLGAFSLPRTNGRPVYHF